MSQRDESAREDHTYHNPDTAAISEAIAVALGPSLSQIAQVLDVLVKNDAKRTFTLDELKAKYTDVPGTLPSPLASLVQPQPQQPPLSLKLSRALMGDGKVVTARVQLPNGDGELSYLYDAGGFPRLVLHRADGDTVHYSPLQVTTKGSEHDSEK